MPRFSPDHDTEGWTDSMCSHYELNDSFTFNFHIKSDFMIGMVNLGVCSKLSFQAVGLVLGNDQAGGQVYLRPMVMSKGSDAIVFT